MATETYYNADGEYGLSVDGVDYVCGVFLALPEMWPGSPVCRTMDRLAAAINAKTLYDDMRKSVEMLDDPVTAADLAYVREQNRLKRWHAQDRDPDENEAGVYASELEGGCP